MRFLIVFFILLSSLSAEIEKKWSSNKQCEGCHIKISTKWETSRHSNSHFSKNDLYKKSLEYMVDKSPKLILNEIKIKCAKCHNPRITKQYMKSEDKILAAMGIEGSQKEYNEALNAEHVKNGINCIVCHNVDEIHLDKEAGSGGLNSIKFGTQGIMYGPLDDANSPYHKTEQRAHFTDDNPMLCFTCHHNAKNAQGLEVYATGKEYDEHKNSEQEEGCKNCHMSEKKEGVASNFPISGKQPRKRMVRDHQFASVDNSNIFNEQVDVKDSKADGQFVISIHNKTPHSVPTGYGLREIIINVEFFDNDNKLIEKSQETIGTIWKDKRGNVTIPHLAQAMIKDTRVQAKSTKEFGFNIPNNTRSVSYKLTYKLISPYMAKEIGVTDEFFLKDYVLLERKIGI